MIVMTTRSSTSVKPASEPVPRSHKAFLSDFGSSSLRKIQRTWSVKSCFW